MAGVVWVEGEAEGDGHERSSARRGEENVHE